MNSFVTVPDSLKRQAVDAATIAELTDGPQVGEASYLSADLCSCPGSPVIRGMAPMDMNIKPTRTNAGTRLIRRGRWRALRSGVMGRNYYPKKAVLRKVAGRGETVRRRLGDSACSWLDVVVVADSARLIRATTESGS